MEQDNPECIRGAGKWLTIHRYNETEQNTKVCLDHLKSEGYKIIATSPCEYAEDYPEFESTEKIAVIFGSEETGINDYAKKDADGFIKIPMQGFIESFNISVSAAIILDIMSIDRL